MKIWWCNQSRQWNEEFQAKAVCSSDDTDQPKFRRTVGEARKGDLVLHYRSGHGIVAISRVAANAIRYKMGDRRSICRYSDHGGGWAFPTEYHLLTPPIPKDAIIGKLIKLEMPDSPVLRFADGRKQVRQAYFIPTSPEALDIVMQAGRDRAWPGWVAYRPSDNMRSRPPAVDNSVSAIEGLAKETTVLTRKRSRELRKIALDNAGGKCEACDTDFSKLMNGAGTRVLQVHHKKQLSLADVPQETTLKDLAVLCANCHSLIHLDLKKAMTVPQLRKKLGRP